MITSTNNESKHCFGTPMPGQGRSRVCIRCGGREVVVADNPCPGSPEPIDGAYHVSDYDPLEDA